MAAGWRYILLAFTGEGPAEALGQGVATATRARLVAFLPISGGACVGHDCRPGGASGRVVGADWLAVAHVWGTLDGFGARAAPAVTVAQRIVEGVDGLGA